MSFGAADWQNKYGLLTCENCGYGDKAFVVHVTVEVDRGQNPSSPPYEEQHWCVECVKTKSTGDS